MSAPAKVGVVLVNWRSWRDTVLSLETLFGGSYPAFDAVVVDNASCDDSVKQILAWAQGYETVACPELLTGKVSLRPSTTMIPHRVIDEDKIADTGEPSRLTIIRATDNDGFASGNNIGLRYLLQYSGYDFFWLLNNDAFPAHDALTHLVARAEGDADLGMVGSTLIYAGRPDMIQAMGGAEYQKKHGRGVHIGAETNVSDLFIVREADIEGRMAYIVGASMLVSRRFLERVGLMEEGYFLYFEEIDWAERGKPEFKLGYAKQSLVFHKAGGSTQAASRRSEMAAYYIARNRLVFTRRFYPEYAGAVYRATWLDAIKYAVKRHWSEARGFFRAVLESPRKLNSVRHT